MFIHNEIIYYLSNITNRENVFIILNMIEKIINSLYLVSTIVQFYSSI